MIFYTCNMILVVFLLLSSAPANKVRSTQRKPDSDVRRRVSVSVEKSSSSCTAVKVIKRHGANNISSSLLVK